MLVVDSFKALGFYAADQGEFRRFLHSLSGRLSAFPVTSLWLGEYDPAELTTAPEFAVADAIVSLTSDRTSQRELRILQVLKLRGSGFLSGEHAYRLSAAGIEVFPRLADPVDPAAYPLPTERISSASQPWTPCSPTATGRGRPPGRRPLGRRQDPHGPALCRQRGPPRRWASSPPCRRTRPACAGRPRLRLVAGRGWDRAAVPLPVDLYIDQWVHELLAAIERTGARRVLIDSLGDLAFAAGDEARYREYLYSLVQRCSRLGVSLLMTYELPELFQLVGCRRWASPTCPTTSWCCSTYATSLR